MPPAVSPPVSPPNQRDDGGFTLVETALSVVLLSIVLLSITGGIFVMLTVTRDTQGIVDVSAERAVARPYLVRDFQAVMPEANGNWGTDSTVWINANPDADPPPAVLYPAPFPADILALKGQLLAPLGSFTSDWTPGLLLPGCDPIQPQKCRYFSDNPLQANDVRQSFRFRCDPNLSAPGGVEPTVPVFLLWTETWFGQVTDLSGTSYTFNRPVSTQIIYKLVRSPKDDPANADEAYRCDLVRDVHFFPTPEDQAYLATIPAPNDAATVAEMFKVDSSIVSRNVASVDPRQSGSPPAWSEIKEVRCDASDPDGAGGPLPPQVPDDNCHWKWEITLQVHPELALGPEPVHIVVSQRARTDAT